MAAVMTFVFVRMRNRSERRVLPLAPREVARHLVPWPAVCRRRDPCLTPLPFMTNPNLVFPATIVALVSTMMIVAASMVGGMSATSAGEDAEIELVVEFRVLATRRNAALYCDRFTVGVLRNGALAGNARARDHASRWRAGTIHAVTFLGAYGWWTVCFLRKAKPADHVHVL